MTTFKAQPNLIKTFHEHGIPPRPDMISDDDQDSQPPQESKRLSPYEQEYNDCIKPLSDEIRKRLMGEIEKKENVSSVNPSVSLWRLSL